MKIVMPASLSELGITVPLDVRTNVVKEIRNPDTAKLVEIGRLETAEGEMPLFRTIGMESFENGQKTIELEETVEKPDTRPVRPIKKIVQPPPDWKPYREVRIVPEPVRSVSERLAPGVYHKLP